MKWAREKLECLEESVAGLGREAGVEILGLAQDAGASLGRELARSHLVSVPRLPLLVLLRLGLRRRRDKRPKRRGCVGDHRHHVEEGGEWYLLELLFVDALGVL